MTVFSLADLAEMDIRLARRLRSSDPATGSELLPLIRTTLVAAGYQSVVAESGLLSEVSVSVWKSHGFNAVGPNRWKAEPWTPSWLDHRGTPPDEAVARREQRRPDWRISADRFYSNAVHREEYLNPGQKAAVRAVSIAKPGDAIVCVLPTGSGKTDVLLTRALASRPRQACVIVPTTALALDLERRTRELTGDRTSLAYHGGLTKDSRADFARRVKEGTQWLVITSPEAACMSLARPLEAAAAEGRLDMLVIDEAHMVAEWGDDFRPAFQSFAGLCRRLADVSPADRKPITLMVTATLDDYGLETLKRLFPGDRDLLITAQTTRPEPAWWFSRCADESEKRDRFLEVCRHLPRPLIVYTSLHTSERSTNVQTALQWLSAAGLRAVSSIAGGIAPSELRAAADGLAMRGDEEADVDIVVATSAFGLGVDIPGVRGVIHLCVPESVDRLYQEVGRGGRDGQASASVVLWTGADEAVARSMSEARLISDAKAWERWNEMRRLGAADSGLLQVDLTTPVRSVSYPWSGANVYWNLQTLSAMDRAGMISLDWRVDRQIREDASEAEMQDAFSAHRNSTAVRLIHTDLAYEAPFRERFKRAQRQSRAAGSASLQSALTVLTGFDGCVNRFLADHYRLTTDSGHLTAVRQCGGCPHCRATRALPTRSLLPVPPLFHGQLTVEPRNSLIALAPDRRLCVWTEGRQPDAEAELVKRLTAHGVIALVSSAPWFPVPPRAGQLWWEERIGDRDSFRDALAVPTLVRLHEEYTLPKDAAFLLARLSGGPLTVVLTTADQPNPTDDRLLMRESWGQAYRIDHILRRL